ncbi:MAG: carotenoid oxygenase family protein [Legionellales bacterium]|nr:carotenoid oxygenase family protein [Legionellales bacterium]
MIKLIAQKFNGFLSLLLSFLPWILYSLVAGHSLLSKEIGIFTAIVITLILNFDKIRKKFILDCFGLLFFIALGLGIYYYPHAWWINHTGIVSNLAITTITLISLIIKIPFTLQYAKETTPEFLWKTEGFLKVNQVITRAWGGVFLLNSLLQCGVAMNWWNNSFSSIAEIILYLLVIRFTRSYPEYYRAQRYWAYRQHLKPLNTRFLKGNFSPITQESESHHLDVEGHIPPTLQGIYMRNGPNPQFEPFSYQYPFDGDAMIHAIYFQDGKVSYRNRFVLTPELAAERCYGGAIYASVMTPVKPDARLLNDHCDPQIKAGNFIHIIKLGNNYLALHESNPAYQLSRDLDTLGKWHPQNDPRIIPINAHTRKDPDTQSLYAINYNIDKPPYLTLYHFDNIGNLIEEINIEKNYPTMIHDFLMTKNYVIIIDSPVIFDIKLMAEKKNILQWRPELGTAIGLILRANLKKIPIWINTKSFFAFHYSNAFERDGRIEFIGAHTSPFPDSVENDSPTQLIKTTIDLSTYQVDFKDLGINDGEFMRINDHYQGKINRYLYMPISVNNSFSRLVKYDDETGAILSRDFSGYELSEPIFVPTLNSNTEDEGYIGFFAHHLASNKSYYYLLHANNFLEAPQAIIHLPHRVPNGLHGNFFHE